MIYNIYDISKFVLPEDAQVRRELDVFPAQFLEVEPQAAADEDAAIVDGHEEVGKAEDEDDVARVVLPLLENRPHAFLDSLCCQQLWQCEPILRRRFRVFDKEDNLEDAADD